MTDTGQPAPPALQAPIAHQPSTQSAQPPVPLAQPVHAPQLNWSHFKPKFASKSEEDAEAHLLRTNDWMDTQAFQDGVKVQHLCITLVGEAGLW